MKKTFNKPFLTRYDIKLNENIATSWEWFDKEGKLTYIYHFTQLVNDGTGNLAPMTDQGCYQYITNNMSWNTDSYLGPNWPGQVNEWLSHFYASAELSYKDSIAHGTPLVGDGLYYESCFG